MKKIIAILLTAILTLGAFSAVPASAADSGKPTGFATDAALRRAIRGLEGSMTVFIVSQRTASIMNADRILVLDDGKIAGEGTHAQLLQSCPLYQEIFYSQFPEKRPKTQAGGEEVLA